MLPSELLDRLFGKLAVRYGDAWFRKWDGIPMSAVRADWAEVLDGVGPESIGYGLKYLPGDFPPTAAAFRELCNRRPMEAVPLLEHKHVNGPASAEAIERLKRIKAEITRHVRPQ